MRKHCIFEHIFKFLNQIGPKGTLIVTHHLYTVPAWVRTLKLCLLDSFKVLNNDEVRKAVELNPQILDVAGPVLKAAFNAFTKDNWVFGKGLKPLRAAFRKEPALLGIQAATIERAFKLISKVFEEESAVIFATHPELMMLGNEIEHLFNKMDYELGEEFMRTRLKWSVTTRSICTLIFASIVILQVNCDFAI